MLAADWAVNHRRATPLFNRPRSSDPNRTVDHSKFRLETLDIVCCLTYEVGNLKRIADVQYFYFADRLTERSNVDADYLTVVRDELQKRFSDFA